MPISQVSLLILLSESRHVPQDAPIRYIIQHVWPFKNIKLICKEFMFQLLILLATFLSIRCVRVLEFWFAGSFWIAIISPLPLYLLLASYLKIL